MNRREAMKMAAIATVATAVGSEAKMLEEHMNRMKIKPENPAKMSKGELKHTPQITLGQKDAKGYTMVEITVGQGGIIHPSTPDHWIDFIELYVDGKLVGKNILEPEISRGATAFAVKLDGAKKLKAKAGCNLHGIWTSTLAV